jgi:hypothetical protein
VEKVLGKEGAAPPAGDAPATGGIVPPGVEVELLGAATLTLAQVESAAVAQGKGHAVPPAGPSPLVLAAPLSVTFNPLSFELPLTHPKKGNKRIGGLFVQAIAMEEV